MEHVLDLRKSHTKKKITYSDIVMGKRVKPPKQKVFEKGYKPFEASNLPIDVPQTTIHETFDQEKKCILVGGFIEDKNGKTYIPADKSQLNLSSDFFGAVHISDQDLLELYGLKPEECHILESGNRNWESELRGLSRVERGNEFRDGGGSAAVVQRDLPVLMPLMDGSYQAEKEKYNL